MIRAIRVLAVAASSAIVISSHCAIAQEGFPNRPIRMLVPFSAGSQIDILARWVGEKMTEKWGQQVVVDNRPSAGGTIASAQVARAAPDGYTLMMISIGHAGNATLYSKLPYDIVRDFSGVSRVASSANVLVVPPSLGVKSVRQLIALAQSRPGTLNYSSAGIGSGSQINGEMFKAAIGVDIVHVPFKGAPEALFSVITGSVQLLFSPVLVAAPHIKSGKVSALAVSTATRSPAFPELPTVAEAALPGFDYDQWYGVITTSKAPRPLIHLLNKEVVRIINLPEVRERMLSQGVTPRPSTPEEFDAFIQAEIRKLSRVLGAAGTKMDF